MGFGLATSPGYADALSDAAGHYEVGRTSVIAFDVGQVGGGGISGRFTDFSGTFDLSARNVGDARVSFVIRPASVATGQARIDSFLRSGAVFDVGEYPEIAFRSDSVERTGENSARVYGTISARNATYRVPFEVRLERRTAATLTLTVTGNVPRMPFGMGIGVPIYDNDVKFTMSLVAFRNGDRNAAQFR